MNKKIHIIGSGFTGLTIANILAKHNINVVIYEQRGKIGGNCSSHEEDGIEVHEYGPHIFHTSDSEVWKFVQQYADFNQFKHEVLSNCNGKVYHLPFGLDLVNSFFNVSLKPNELEDFLSSKRIRISNPQNLEEQALSLVGKEIYEAFIKGYTQKQWNANPKDLPAYIIRRLPFRNTYNNNYYDDLYQGIPIDGYQKMFERMADSPFIDVKLNTSFTMNDINNDDIYFYAGQIDRLMNFKYGMLEWRSLQFDFKTISVPVFQGNSVMNYPDLDVPYTRICEYQFFHPERKLTNKTILSYEYPASYDKYHEAYYPIDTKENVGLYNRYVDEFHKAYPNVILCGRLAQYKYFDMDDAIKNAMDIANAFIQQIDK